MATSALATQLQGRSAALRRIRSRIDGVVQAHGSICFPHLVILSDTDYRTVLLLLETALRERELRCLRTGLIATTASSFDGDEASGTCSSCVAGAPVLLSEDIDATFRQLFSTMSIAPSLFYGQRGITCQSALRRAACMVRRGDVTGKRILFLGDNDYQSVAVGLTHAAAKITVVDIDVRVLDNIRMAGQHSGFEVETVHHDLYSNLPDHLRGAYDVFVFDPYPSPDASFERMVLRCGLQALRSDPGGVGYTFASPTHKAIGHLLPLQRTLTDMGLAMTDLIPRLVEFVPIVGELLEDERHLIARFNTGAKPAQEVVSHTKSLLRFETTSESSQAGAQSDSPEPAADLSWRENLVRVMGSHYLVRAVGFDSQKQLVLSSVGDRDAWESAFRGLQTAPVGDVMPVGNLMTEVVGHPLSDDDCVSLLADDPTEAQRLAQMNGYVVTAQECEALRTMALTGYEGMAAAKLTHQMQSRGLYLLARVFASYFRHRY
jgi:predicted methyltransferase